MPEQKKAVVPRLRFPEFRNAGPWEVKKIGDLFSITRGKVLPMNLISDSPSLEKPYPVYSSQTKNNGLAGYYSEYLFENAITWTTDGANAGDVNYRKGKFYCTNVCGVLLSDEGYANTFVAELLNTITRKHVSYVGNPKLMNGVMAQIEIPIPHLPEQQKIADCLSSLDELIELQAKKLEALQAHKKGLMQQLFPREGETTPRLRFPEFRNAGPWEVKRLGEICAIKNGSSNAQDHTENGIYPLFDRSEVIKKSNRYLYDCEAVIIPGEGATFTPRYYRGKFDLHQRAYALMGFRANARFVGYQIEAFKNLLVSQAVSSTVLSLRMPILERFTVLLPTGAEQQKIADCLSSLDELIELEAKKLEALKAHKKGLMQQLFPQEIDL